MLLTRRGSWVLRSQNSASSCNHQNQTKGQSDLAKAAPNEPTWQTDWKTDKQTDGNIGTSVTTVCISCVQWCLEIQKYLNVKGQRQMSKAPLKIIISSIIITHSPIKSQQFLTCRCWVTCYSFVLPWHGSKVTVMAALVLIQLECTLHIILLFIRVLQYLTNT